MLQLGFLIFLENQRLNMRTGEKKYFLWMLIITFLSFSAEMLSSFQADSDWLFRLTSAGNYIEIILNTLLIPIYYRYVCNRIYDLNPSVRRRLDTALWVMAALCVGFLISTAFTGWVFYYDTAKVYHRGPLFSLLMAGLFVMMILIEGFLISQRQKIEKHYFRSLVLFLVAPIIGWGLQLLIYGLPFSLLGISFASLVLFTNIQNRNIDMDYLTEVFNRQALDSYIRRKIEAASRNKTFSAILLDIDDFKAINDKYGHLEGDAALINAAQILRESVSFTDFIARYGGDEFCIILDSDDPETVESTMRKIDGCLRNFIENKNKPYTLSFSMGYSVYKISDGKGPEAFLREVDHKMYENKHVQKGLKA